ncbi:MAG: glyoxalase [Hyphomicrobiales bacterium]|nr:glyoxalase [Hyphomicrobiales bacterium]
MSSALDHVVLAARDLSAQADFYRRLGFRVGARNHHPWGTQNHIVQFDGAFLELIGTEGAYHAPVDPDPRVFSFAGFIHDYLERREGAAKLALSSGDAEAEARRFKQAGVGDFEPFHFERRGKRASGEETRVAFTLAFAASRLLPDAGFFVCQQRRPQDFWDPALQTHANGVSGLRSVVMAAENPSDHAEFLSHFTGVRDMAATSMGVDIPLPGGQRIEVLTPVAFAYRYGAAALGEGDGAPRLAAITFAVSDRSALDVALAGANPPRESVQGRTVIPPSAAFGVALVF